MAAEDLKKGRNSQCPQLLDLIPAEREWKGQKDPAQRSRTEIRDDEKSLELRLGLPWEEQQLEDASVLSLGHFSKNASFLSGIKRVYMDTTGCKGEVHIQQQQSRAGRGFELSLKRSGGERKASSHTTHGTTTTATHARPPAVPVVGWPPIRNSRKNLRAGSSKQSLEPHVGEQEARAKLASKTVPFVKINMDGIPIGRKIDLAVYDSYEKLAVGVRELFHGLLEAQKDPSFAGKEDDGQIFGRLLDGTGKYTLVYEDNEGDKILVGDVPWNDFVCSVKRLRVLKSSELSSETIRAVGKRPMEC